MIESRKSLEAWRIAAARRESELLAEWRDNRRYTSIILNNSGCLLDEVAHELRLAAYPRNYYSVDGLLYTEQDKVPGSPESQFWFRTISVAFEHENSFDRDLYQEIAHLLILQAQLSVIVTYSTSYDEKLMKYFHSIIQPCPHAAELHASENFLMILGQRDPLKWGWLRVQGQELAPPRRYRTKQPSSSGLMKAPLRSESEPPTKMGQRHILELSIDDQCWVAASTAYIGSDCLMRHSLSHAAEHFVGNGPGIGRDLLDRQSRTPQQAAFTDVQLRQVGDIHRDHVHGDAAHQWCPPAIEQHR